MKAFRVFILGLLYGWLVKVAIDRIYRDNEIEDVRNENTALKEYIRSLESRLQPKSLEAKSVKRTTAQAGPVETVPGRDDLKAIKGVGPTIESKLNNTGIHTFEAMARLTVEELENILGSTKRLVQDPASLIAQAEELARQKDQQ